MFWNLILTDSCNLCCTYCRGKDMSGGGCDTTAVAVAVDDTLPSDLAVDPDLLYAFLARDPDAALMFYGGEPLLRMDLVEQILEEAPVRRFLLQTNGTLLSGLDPDLVRRFDTIFLSVDGPEAVTDRYRGSGTFKKVIAGARHCAGAGFSGELIARMTVAEATDIEASVRYLSGNDLFPFSSIHWQIDANFAEDYYARAFAPWVHGSYNPGISRLVDAWVGAMRREGRVLRWYPFLVPVDDLLHDRPSPLRCGSGHANYTIMTDGSIAPCPCMVGMRDWYVGHIASADPRNIRVVPVGGECTSCDIRDFCGGRCLYSNIIRPWPPEGRSLVRSTVCHLHAALTAVLPEIRALIDEGRIEARDFFHEKFQGCEVIP
ncbi:MAG: TIGR04084 family radical SAM/SPASM domain-containing protein [Methanomicrobiales archaeon]|nr:TIGR04084 family radical SAM/SPASM domain-containing protein [Methanomicrobiales archaeon]